MCLHHAPLSTRCLPFPNPVKVQCGAALSLRHHAGGITRTLFRYFAEANGQDAHPDFMYHPERKQKTAN